MKRYVFFFFTVLSVCSCADWLGETSGKGSQDADGLSHEMIVLGDKLDDPYSLTNMQNAVAALYPDTKAGREGLTETDIYVRFLPKDNGQYDLLSDMGVELIDHPLDYEIVREGDYYHDPELEESQMTWQYAVVSPDFNFPSTIRYEVLEKCYIPERDASTRADGIDWEAVERKSYILSGNEDLLLPETRGGDACQPSGNISIVDDKMGDGAVGVKGVKISVNSFVKYSHTYTDENGDYTIPRSYSTNIRYRIVYKNTVGFGIGVNLLVTPASACTLGKSEPDGVSVVIDKDSDRKMFSRSVVNNAAYDFFSMCKSSSMPLTSPPRNVRFWLFQNLGSSCAVMLQQGTIFDMEFVSKYLGVAATIIRIFMPDITLGLSGCNDYASIYAVASHELAHAAHFKQTGTKFWDKYIVYVLKSAILEGSAYGSGEGEDAGYCEVGEMWAFYLENRLYMDRYGEESPSSRLSHWFDPHILTKLDEKGINRSMLFRAFDSSVTDKDQLKEKLMSLYPDNKILIEQNFSLYNYE